MPRTRNYYAILGVLPTAEIIVIRAAYRALAQKYHPDTWRGDKSESDARMRDLNEAYEALSNTDKRKHYDSQQKQQNDYDFDYDDETMRSAFGEAEKAQATDWTLATEYYPDLLVIYKRLARSSDKLAFAYRTMLLDSKNFEKRLYIANEMEKEFLERYFGNDPEIIIFAKSLINTGNKAAAKELNRVVSVLGKTTDAKRIIQRISEKFNISSFDLGPPSLSK
jgi:curved DNA-binding protein CbpA